MSPVPEDPFALMLRHARGTATGFSLSVLGAVAEVMPDDGPHSPFRRGSYPASAFIRGWKTAGAGAPDGIPP